MNLKFTSLTPVILLGIITFSTSRPQIQQLKQRNITQELKNVIVNCLDLPSKKEFNTSTYFQDEWYLDRFYALNFPKRDNLISLCSKMKYEFSSKGPSQCYDNHGVEILGVPQQSESERKILYMTKAPNYISITNITGKFMLCDLDSKGESTGNCHTEVTVLDTDYVNYSIEYSCGREGSIDSASIIKIYARKSYIVDEKVETSLKKFGLKMEDFKLSLDPLDTEKSRCNFVGVIWYW